MIERELLRQQWSTVANSLSIKFIAPFFLQLPNGTQKEFACHLPQFGGEKGILIDNEYSAAAFSAAKALVYCISSMQAEASHLPIDPQNYIECLLDWGRACNEKSPKWYTNVT